MNSNSILKKYLPILLIIISFLIGSLLRLHNMQVYHRSPDERVYTNYAAEISQNNPLSLKKSEKLLNSHAQTRIGYLYTSAWLMKIFNSQRMGVLAMQSCIASIFTLIIIIVISLRFFNHWVAAIAVSLYSVFPAELSLANRAWPDAPLGFLALFLIYCSCEIMSKPSNKIWITSFFIVGTYMLIIKESALILLILCSLYIVWNMVATHQKRASLFFITGIILCIGFAYGLVIMVVGGIEPILKIYSNAQNTFSTNPYILEYHTVPYYGIIQGLFALSPIMTIMFFIGMISLLLRSSNHEELRYKGVLCYLCFIISSFSIIMFIPIPLRNLRYLSPIFPAISVVSAVGMWFLLNKIKSGYKYLSLIIIFSIVMYLDFTNYENLYMWRLNQNPDLVIPILTKYSIYTGK